MKKHLWMIGLVTWCMAFIAGCGPVVGVKTAVPLKPTMVQSTATTRVAVTSTATQTTAPTRTPIPTWTVAATTTAIPSFTPTPTVTIPARLAGDGLRSKGPYLIFPLKMRTDAWDTNQAEEETSLIALDADGAGKQVFSLPDKGYLSRFETAISPNGDWIAYYTGTPMEPDTNGKYAFALHLYQWRSGKSIKVTELLSSDYPGNFEKTLKMLQDSDPQWKNNPDGLESLRNTFITGIFRQAWSPDGRYLAFAAETDGPSSDLYLYVLSTGEVHRLSDGPENIEWLEWTPDSQKILHYSEYQAGEGESGNYYVAQVDDKAWKLEASAYGGVNIFADWVSSNQIALYSHANGYGGPLRYLNIDSGEDRVLFPPQINEADYDPVEHRWLIMKTQSPNDTLQPGLYLFDPGTKQSRMITMEYCRKLRFLGSGELRFSAYCGKTLALRMIRRDGQIMAPVDGEILINSLLSRSPDGKWMVAVDDSWEALTRWYDVSGDLQDKFLGYPIRAFVWKPDSNGFYFVSPGKTTSGDTLYYYSLQERQVVRVVEGIELFSFPDYAEWPHQWTR